MGKKKGKVNPRRVPVTQADINRAKDKATSDAIRRIVYLMLYILIDKHDAPMEDIQQLAEEVNYYSESIAEKRITWKDIERVVRDEYKVFLPW